VVHVTESLFSPLGDSIQRGDVEHAEVILEAEPDHERAKVFRLRFAMLRIRHATNPVQNHVETPNAAEKRIQNLLYGIFIVLVLILIELWRRREPFSYLRPNSRLAFGRNRRIKAASMPTNLSNGTPSISISTSGIHLTNTSTETP